MSEEPKYSNYLKPPSHQNDESQPKSLMRIQSVELKPSRKIFVLSMFGNTA